MIAGHALANKAKFEEFASYDKDDARLLTRRTKNLRISVYIYIYDIEFYHLTLTLSALVIL